MNRIFTQGTQVMKTYDTHLVLPGWSIGDGEWIAASPCGHEVAIVVVGGLFSALTGSLNWKPISELDGWTVSRPVIESGS